ncbi:MAG: hypothetical protein P4L84_36090 [Isosphaeraceae bacterium]|nr:hypothetical protein [Isosphaeraceae bacterium]
MLRQISVLAGLVLVGLLPLSSRAQGMVPGGWEPQFGYQVFVGPGAVGYGASAGFGFGQPGAYGYGYSGYGGISPYGAGFGYPGYYGGGAGFNPMANRVAYTPQPDQAVSAMNPLIQSIRQTTRKRKGR